jgi:hypothetical protein
MLLNKDRLSHWLIAAPLGWAVWTVLLFIPIFHLWLGFPVAKITVYSGIACAVQIAVTPWAFLARVTPQNPKGKVFQRYAVASVLVTATALLLVYWLQRGEPINPYTTQVRMILFSAPVVFGVVSLAIIGPVLRSRGKKRVD